jgi:hypothetical protein
MKEIVTVNGKQFEIVTEYPLTEQQRQQTISDIRKQSGCSTCNQAHGLEGNILGLANPDTGGCISVKVAVPATITVKNIKIVDMSSGTGIDDTCGTGTCTTIACGSVNACIVVRDVVVTLENSGDIDADVALTLKIRNSPTSTSPIHVTVYAATGTPPAMTPTPASVTFAGVELTRGTNDVCATFTFVPFA